MRLANKTACHNEYERLKEVIVTTPKYMRIDQIINETQKYYQDDNIDINKALAQHRYFTDVLKSNGVGVIEIEAKPTLNEQVFTRDIGMTIGNQVFVAEMATELRKGETAHFKETLSELNIAHRDIGADSIEGGDVIIDGDTIWVGISKRTSEEAAEALQQILPEYHVETVHLVDDVLHLDCAFNLVSKNIALIYPDGMAEKDYQKLKARYQCIEVDEEEQFTLGTNVLSIEEGKLISLPENVRTNEKLRAEGFDVIEVPFNEIIKSGGSFRCCTMPVYRQK